MKKALEINVADIVLRLRGNKCEILFSGSSIIKVCQEIPGSYKIVGEKALIRRAELYAKKGLLSDLLPTEIFCQRNNPARVLRAHGIR